MTRKSKLLLWPHTYLGHIPYTFAKYSAASNMVNNLILVYFIHVTHNNLYSLIYVYVNISLLYNFYKNERGSILTVFKKLFEIYFCFKHILLLYKYKQTDWTKVITLKSIVFNGYNHIN